MLSLKQRQVKIYVFGTCASLSDSGMYDNLIVAADILWGQGDKELIQAKGKYNLDLSLGLQGSYSSNSNDKEQLLHCDRDEDEDEEPPECRHVKVKRRQVMKCR